MQSRPSEQRRYATRACFAETYLGRMRFDNRSTANVLSTNNRAGFKSIVARKIARAGRKE